ncbi:hypothetical protein ACFLYF_00995 [Chloroflexota bacterium]
MDWHGIWDLIITIWDASIVHITNMFSHTSVWIIIAIAGCLLIEGIRRFVITILLRNHLRNVERAARNNRIGVIEKPSWERKRNKEFKIDNNIFHPLQREPGGLWLQIASDKESIQNQVLLVSDYQRLVHDSEELKDIALDFHTRQHKKQAKFEIALGVIFIFTGIFISSAYYILNLLH